MELKNDHVTNWTVCIFVVAYINALKKQCDIFHILYMEKKEIWSLLVRADIKVKLPVFCLYSGFNGAAEATRLIPWPYSHIKFCTYTHIYRNVQCTYTCSYFVLNMHNKKKTTHSAHLSQNITTAREMARVRAHKQYKFSRTYMWVYVYIKIEIQNSRMI